MLKTKDLVRNWRIDRSWKQYHRKCNLQLEKCGRLSYAISLGAGISFYFAGLLLQYMPLIWISGTILVSAIIPLAVELINYYPKCTKYLETHRINMEILCAEK